MVEFIAEFGDGGVPVSGDGRLDAPSFHRNCPAVTDELRKILAGRTGDVLEIASGTGQHIVEFARAMPDITWWPSDHIPRHLDSIEGWRRGVNRANLRASLLLDAAAPDWPLGGSGAPPASGLTAIVCLNMLHIAPWPVALGLLRGAARHLAGDGVLAVYGPFKIDGTMTADSTNMAATVSSAGFEKPATASSGETRPSAATPTLSPRPTTSTRMVSVTKSTRAAASSNRTRVISITGIPWEPAQFSSKPSGLEFASTVR